MRGSIDIRDIVPELLLQALNDRNHVPGLDSAVPYRPIAFRVTAKRKEQNGGLPLELPGPKSTNVPSCGENQNLLQYDPKFKPSEVVQAVHRRIPVLKTGLIHIHVHTLRRHRQ